MTHIANLRVLTLEQLDELIPEILLMEAWTSAARELIQSRLEQGDQMVHAELVPKRAMRKWAVGTIETQEMLTSVLNRIGVDSSLDVVAPRVVLSPAQAEKLVGKPVFQKWLSGIAPAESSGMNLKLK